MYEANADIMVGCGKWGKSVKDLQSKDTRSGTYDALLNRLKD